MTVLFIFISGCATSSSNIKPSYVSPLTYNNYDCEQLKGEKDRIIEKTLELSKKQDFEAGKDAIALTAGLVIFWPALFFMIGSDHSDQISRLKGEYDSLESVQIEKNCIEKQPIFIAAITEQKDSPYKFFTDEKNKTLWVVVVDEFRLNLASAEQVCGNLDFGNKEKFKVPSIEQLETLYRNYKDDNIKEIFESREYVSSSQPERGLSAGGPVFSFKIGTTSTAFSGHVSCVVKL